MMTLNLVLATTLIASMAIASGLDTPETPFACNLKALTSTERAEHKQVTARVLAAVAQTREIPTGYTFTVDPTRVTPKELATFVEFERRCCPFFDFHLAWSRENGPVTLQLTGRDGVKAFIRAEFGALFHQ
jgi:hypothetical protein